MPGTYEKVQSTTLVSAQTSTVFSSISQSYTDLVLIISALGSSTSDYIKLNINSDTGSNYSNTAMYGDGVTAATGKVSNQTFSYLTYYPFASTTQPNLVIANFQNYSNTTTYKTFLSRANTQITNSGPDAIVGAWRSTSAITSLTIATTGGGNFNIGSTFTIYGILKA